MKCQYCLTHLLISKKKVIVAKIKEHKLSAVRLAKTCIHFKHLNR